MSINESEKFSYSKPIIVDLRGQSSFAACTTGPGDTTGPCAPLGSGANTSCDTGRGFGDTSICDLGGSETDGLCWGAGGTPT